MNYQKIYDSIVQKAKSENRIKLKRTDENFIYYENHHIIPRCLGGSDDKSNLVLLTAREHFIAHKLLVEIYPKDYKLVYSLHNMIFKKNSKNLQRNYKISSREFERIRIKFSIVHSSRIITEELRNKLRLAQKGVKNHNYGKPRSDETRKKISEANKGRRFSEEHIEKLRTSHRGYIHTQEQKEKIRLGNLNKKVSLETIVKMKIAKSNQSKETRLKISQALKNQPKINCPHCNKILSICNSKRYHFDNCKFKN